MWFGYRFQRQKKYMCVCVCVCVCFNWCYICKASMNPWIKSKKEITFLILSFNYNFKHFNLTFSEKLQMLLQLIQCFLEEYYNFVPLSSSRKNNWLTQQNMFVMYLLNALFTSFSSFKLFIMIMSVNWLHILLLL